ncbi:MAG: hypothetical protein IJK92_09395 [Bacteroidales bacterium]|nr:hypothetical protein [Bacteroidales bacterium]
MKKTFLIIAILAPMFAWAQTENDMLDFSTVYYHGTAKSAAMGNAMGAVGSDFSAIAINPAGLGLFRKSYVIWTPEFYSISTESKYKGSTGEDRTFKVPMNNIGLSWTQEINDGSLTSVSFALGINKLNNFTFDSYVKGDNPNTSLVYAYGTEIDENGITSVNALENYSPNQIYPLYQTYVIDTINQDGCYTWVPCGGINQQYGVSKRGTAKEFSFATGFNFNEKLFLGVSLNVPYFDKNTTTEYKEKNLNSGDFNNWSQTEYIKNSGYGVNAKIGAIVYPAKWLRLGAAFHTPSLYRVTESWYTETRSSMSFGNFSYESPTGTYNYTVTTPLRLNASAAFIFGNFGMITGDYEYVDYSKMRASSHDFDYSNLNDFIRDMYKASSNIRIGTEWRWQTLVFRAGYAIYGSPFGFDKENLKTTSYSCGFGYTYHNFTIDLAYVMSKRDNNYDLYSQYTLYPAYYGENYDLVDDTKVKETTNINQVVISFKLRLD